MTVPRSQADVWGSHGASRCLESRKVLGVVARQGVLSYKNVLDTLSLKFNKTFKGFYTG